MKTYILLILLIFSTNIFGQITFQKNIQNLSSSQTALSIAATSDGGYLVSGAALVPFSSGDVFVMKVSALGDIVWTKIFSGSNDGAAYDVIETMDHGVISTGYYFNNGSTSAFLFKLDSMGNFNWMHEYGGSSAETGYSVKQLSDSGFVLAGYTFSQAATSEDIYLIRTNSSGNIIWNKTFSGNAHERAYGLALTAEGGFIMTGYTKGFTAIGDDVILIKTDSSGSVVWSKKFGGALDDIGNSVQQTPDGGYVIAGSVGVSGGEDALLMRTDGSGNLLWSKKYHHLAHNNFSKVLILPGGEYVLAGSSTNTGSAGSDFLLVKTDTMGNVLWSNTYGGNMGDLAYGLLKTNDGFIMTGTGSSFSSVLIVKTDSSGISGCNESPVTLLVDSSSITGVNISPFESSTGTSVPFTPTLTSSGTAAALCQVGLVGELKSKSISGIYPNPASDKITIEYNGKDQFAFVHMTNSLGETIFRSLMITGEIISFNTNQIANGLYNIIVSDKSNYESHKVAIVH
jgi:hypothetical protein